MLEFKEITTGDMAAISEKMASVENPVCVHWFGNLFLWQDYFKTMFCIKDGFLFVRSTIFDGSMWGYLRPIGDGNIEHAIEMLRGQARAENQPLVVFSIFGDTAPFKDLLMLYNRSYADYIYDAESLRSLAGKHLQPKRNHVNRFLKAYPETMLRQLAANDRNAIADLTLRWAEGKDYPTGELMLINRLMDNFEALSSIIRGVIAFDGEKAIAFSFGGFVNENTFDVLMEKADIAYEGAFSFINQALAKSLPPEITLIDREEDLGLPGLRKAKLSYHPKELRLYPTGVEKGSCIGQMFALLKECFGDEDEFVTKYLFYYSKPETRVLIESYCGLSALFNVHIFSSGHFEKAAYLYALSVKPECRGKGLAVEAIRKSMEKAANEGCCIALTIQANKDFNAWQHVFRFGKYSANPINLQTADGFDFGTGDKKQDIAICRILDVESYLRTYAACNRFIETELNIEDGLFPKNTGLYLIKDGHVLKQSMDTGRNRTDVAYIWSICPVEDLLFDFIR